MVCQPLPETRDVARSGILDLMNRLLPFLQEVINGIELRPQTGNEKPHLDPFILVASRVDVHLFTFF
jgi:hypothetical protein